jgi:peptide/nickel transport system substrate-binding protein
MQFLVRLILCLTTTALLGSGGCQRSDSTGPSRAAAPNRPGADKPLVVSVVGDPITFNPIVADAQAGRAVGGAVFDTLVRLDPATAEARPWLASGWTYEPERFEYTLFLRDDAVWHDGQPLTARDVVFTIDAIHADPDSPYHRILQIDGKPIKATEAGTHALRFTLPRPYAPFLKSLVLPIIPAHRFEDRIASGKLESISAAWGPDTAPSAVVGSGPFRLSSYEVGQRIVLERNPYYWRRDAEGVQLPYLDRYIVRIAPDRETARNWFLAGALHIFNPRFDEVAELRGARSANEFIVEEVGTDSGSLFLTFNRNPLHYRVADKIDPRLSWFTDPEFLRAVAHAINRGEIIEDALSGFGVPARSLIPTFNPFCDKDLPAYHYEPERAREILEDAGYRDRNGDGVREDGDGNPLAFSLATNQGNPVRERIGELLVRDLSAIGIRASLEAFTFPELFERLDATYDWDAALIGFTVGIDPASSENLLRSDGDLHVWYPRQPHPASAWEAQVDDLLDQGSRELDPERRHEIYRDVQRILQKQLPMIHLVRPTLFAAHRLEVQNFQPSAWGFHRIEELRLVEPTPTKSAKKSR